MSTLFLHIQECSQIIFTYGKAIVNMYNSGLSIDDIWKVSGFKSRTSVFRVLNRNGVQLNRGRHQGPIKKRRERKK